MLLCLFIHPEIAPGADSSRQANSRQIARASDRRPRGTGGGGKPVAARTAGAAPSCSWRGKAGGFSEWRAPSSSIPTHRSRPQGAVFGGRDAETLQHHRHGVACWQSIPPAGAWQAPGAPGSVGSSPRNRAPAQAAHKSSAVCVSLGSDLGGAEINGLSV